MDRRSFIRNLLLTSGVVLSSAGTGRAWIDEKEHIFRLSRRENPSILERKHVPLIEAPQKVKAGEWFNLTVRVGFLMEHPSNPGHWITAIRLFVDSKEVCKMRFNTGGISAPAASFRIRIYKESRIEAVGKCNLHGMWAADPVTISTS